LNLSNDSYLTQVAVGNIWIYGGLMLQRDMEFVTAAIIETINFFDTELFPAHKTLLHLENSSVPLVVRLPQVENY